MERSESKATVLECVIKNFKKRLRKDYGVRMKPNHLHILCEVKWSPMGVGWPPENTMNLKMVEAVYTVVTGKPGQVSRHGEPPHFRWEFSLKKREGE